MSVYLDTVFPTVRHYFNISLKEAVLRVRNDAEIDPKTRYTLRCDAASMIKDLI